MIVLSILGIVALLYCIYWAVLKLNQDSYKKFQYQFFDKTSIWLIPLGYISIIVGYHWIQNATGNTFNGEVLIVIGIGLLLAQIHRNFKHVSFFYGYFGTMIQFLLFIPITILSIVVVFSLFAMYANAKPVYRID